MIPVAAPGIWLDDGARVSLVIVLMGIASGASHTVYFVLLQRGYATGDLSLVYPLARGTGPIFATAGAIAILGERPGRSRWPARRRSPSASSCCSRRAASAAGPRSPTPC